MTTVKLIDVSSQSFGGDFSIVAIGSNPIVTSHEVPDRNKLVGIAVKLAHSVGSVVLHRCFVDDNTIKDSLDEDEVGMFFVYEVTPERLLGVADIIGYREEILGYDNCMFADQADRAVIAQYVFSRQDLEQVLRDLGFPLNQHNEELFRKFLQGTAGTSDEYVAGQLDMFASLYRERLSYGEPEPGSTIEVIVLDPRAA